MTRTETASPAATTLRELLDRGEAGAPAIRAPGRPPLSYEALRHQTRLLAGCLAGLGVTPADKVAIVLPNGPEMAIAFLGTALAAAAAPLNPAYKKDELDFYLEDLRAKALIVAAEEAGPVIACATERGIPVLRLAVEATSPAGVFAVSGSEPAPIERTSSPADIALVLHTSGTTSRPKIVPLSHANVCASARHITETLALTPADACLNIMPLFHIHGLIAATLAPLWSGGSVICTPGFNALRFMSWLGAERPSWYTAVPTMHQAILDRVAKQPEQARAIGLRLIRSSSASLPPQVLHQLEVTFGCPVIESYGMTEAAHQMASSPLPPRARKPGSVGLAAGPEVQIADATGRLLARGAEGEIVIRGPNVTAGYEGNPKANAEAFFEPEAGDGGRWFRTGDQGVIDDEGYLRITGRIKEIINRGGEKIAPREVDEVIMDHAAVAQAVTFAMPHPKLGEEVAAAVVLKAGERLTEEALRAFVGERVAAFKVPRKIVFLDEIPKGATGKLQRIGLAQKLGLG